MGVASDGGSLRVARHFGMEMLPVSKEDATAASQFYDQAAKAPFQSIAESREIAVRRASMAF